LNPKIFVFIAVLVFVGVLGGIIVVGPTLVVGGIGTDTTNQNVETLPPITIELVDISVLKISERSATIQVEFEIFNPNPRAVIVQTMDYQLFETTFSNYEQLDGGTIGSRPEGMVEFGSNYYTLLGNNSIVLKDKITIPNTQNGGELWDALETNTASYRISGTVYYNLSSMTSGQENTLDYEFFKES
jgi:hypothetical protein